MSTEINQLIKSTCIPYLKILNYVSFISFIFKALYPEDGPVDVCPVKVYRDGYCFYRTLS